MVTSADPHPQLSQYTSLIILLEYLFEYFPPRAEYSQFKSITVTSLYTPCVDKIYIAS